MPVPVKTVKVWINAFIPRDVPQYTRPVPAGIHASNTMIPGPSGFSNCYLTDQRGFSNDVRAKSRMHSEVKIDFSGSRPILSQVHRCDTTTELGCEDGDVKATKVGSTSRMSFQLLPGATVDRAMVSFKCAGSNPCAPISRLFGDIDYFGQLTIDRAARSVIFNGKIDQFPAFEAYVSVNDGPGITIFRESPPPGNTVMNLPGNADRPILKTITFP